MLKAAVRDPNPVVFLENEILYNEPFEVSGEALDPEFVAPIGKVRVMREGSHVTIVTFSKMTKFALQAAAEVEKLGISVEVLNLRSIRPLDRTSIINSVKKTTRLITLEDGWPQCGVGSEICALMMESSAFKYLDAPVVRLTGVDIPTPYAFNLEPMAFPTVEKIVNAIKQITTGVKL